MPCWQVRQTTVALEAADLDALKKALESLGARVYHNGSELMWTDAQGREGRFENGRLKGDARASFLTDPNSVKRAYSAETLKIASKKFGWALKFASPTSGIATKQRF